MLSAKKFTQNAKGLTDKYYANSRHQWVLSLWNRIVFMLWPPFHLRPPKCEQLTDNHAADRSDERFERTYLRRFFTLENVRREGPSLCGTTLPQGTTNQ